MIILSVLVLFIGCRSEKTKAIHFPQLGWTLPVPSDIHFKDSVFDQNGNIKDSAWEAVYTNDKRNRALLFTIRADGANSFNAVVYQDSTDISEWEKETILNSRIGYFDIIASVPEIKIIDSSLSVEKLDNVEFMKEYITYKRKRNDVVYSYQFSRRYKNYAIYINVRYTDKKLGKRYMKMVENSEFEEYL